jgi:hypothetical protein
MMAGKVALGGVFTFTDVSAYPEHPSLSFTSKEYLDILNGFTNKDSDKVPLFHKYFKSHPFVPMMGFIIIESPEQILESEGKVTDILFVVDTKIEPSTTQLFLSVNDIL